MKDKITIVIVDDEIKIVKSIYRILKNFEADVVMFSDPVEAIDFINRNHVDLLITDYLMPVYSGLDVIKTLKINNLESIAIIITGVNDFKVAVSAINEGSVYQFLVKPFDKDELRSVVDEAIELVKEKREYARFKEWSFAKLDDYDEEYVTKLITKNVSKGMMTLMKVKDEELFNHSVRVAQMSVSLGKRLNLSSERLHSLNEAALLHDIGKLAIKDYILEKKSRLDIDEFAEMKRHAEVGALLLDKLGVESKIVLSVEQHHEQIDGAGYPKGLKKDEIIEEAKIISIADVYDAIRSKRSYKEAMDIRKTKEIMAQMSGKAFDERLLKSFLKMIDE